MAKEYEKFKAEWAVIKTEVQAGLDDIKANAAAVAQTSGVIAEGTKELGRRVQVLKDGGQKGDDLKDFIADPEVKQMSASIDSFLSQLEKELKRVDTLHKGAWVKTKDRFWKLRQELDAEIKARKKAVSTKLGTGNKSVPLMEALLKEIDAFKNNQFTTFDAFTPETIAQHRKEAGFKIQDEIRKAKDVRLSEYQYMMMEQGLNTRVLKMNFGRARTVFQGLAAALQKAEAAQKEGKGDALAAAQAEASKLFGELAAMVEPYEKAPKDDWLRTQIQKSKDRSAIEAGIKSFVEMKTRGEAALKKIKAL